MVLSNSVKSLRRMRPYRLKRKWQMSHLYNASSWRKKSTHPSRENSSEIKSMGLGDAVMPMESRHLYAYLKLENFTDAEFEKSFETIQEVNNDDEKESSGSDSITKAHLQNFLEKRISEIEAQSGLRNNNDEEKVSSFRQQFASSEAERCWKFFSESRSDPKRPLTRKEFSSIIKNTASSLDIKRVWPITLSMILVGSSVGVVTPAMPFVVQNLGLSAGEYGLVVSAFALAKMTGNIPSAVLVERHGRKPYLVYSMAVIALGVGGIGLAGSFEELYLCRLFTGLGVAGLSTAATMTVTDISNPLNRASTFAPIMSAFAAGTALGPALGGILCDSIGINPTFFMVGLSYVGLAAVNSFLLQETQPKPMKFPWQKDSNDKENVSIRKSFEDALGMWIPLLSKSPIRNVCLMNGFYWMALAGSQMTLLPLILTDPNGLAMTATNVGQVYMGMSIVQVLGNPILGKAVDRVGKVPGIVTGCALISSAMATLPLCEDPYQMAGILGLWATGSSLLSTAPISFVSDRVDGKSRAQAVALLRTTGDVGFLIGASSMGALADWTGSLDMAMQSSSAVLLTATGWFAARNLLSMQISKDTKQ